MAKWTYDVKDRVLRSEGYSVDLEECRTSAEVLDWIVQISQKAWATPNQVGGLVQALDEILNIQATLCSGGVEQGPVPFEGARGHASMDTSCDRMKEKDA